MEKTGSRRGKLWSAVLIALLVVCGYSVWAIRRPLPAMPAVQPTVEARAAVPASKPLAWPAQGQSAVGIVGSSLPDTHGRQMAVPTASTAKLITALVVLQVKPLQLGQSGPTITLGAKDVALYNNYVAQDGSLVKVQAGEKISEYQMLEAMLLPSANNMADSLAIWAFGSLQAYAEAANQYLESESLVEAHVGSDASGFNPSTTSTARNLVQIGELVMQSPVLAQIVGQPSASGIPVVGTVKNVNFLLGADHIVGIKTGNTDQAGGVFVSASHVTVNSKPVTIVTALMASPTLFQALKDSTPLIQSAQSNFKPVNIVKAGGVVGRYRLPWGGSVSAVADQDISLFGWSGDTIPSTVRLRPIAPTAKAGQVVGSMAVQRSILNNQKSILIKLQATPSQPSIGWRLLHPFN